MEPLEHLPKPKNSAGRDLKSAIGVGALLAGLVIAAALSGYLAWYIFVAVAAVAATWEVTARLREAGYVIPRLLLIGAGQLMVWMSLFYGTSGLVASYVTGVLALMFGRLFHHGRHSAPKNYLRDTSVGIFVLTWIPLFGSFAAMLSLLDSAVSGAYIITFILCVVASDVGGFAAGVMFGSHPMAPAVSPKKSWEGFAGSIIFGMITGALAVHFLLHYEWALGVVLGVVLVICATLGDLVESQFKRELGLKDMSAMLPGHGGLMDRLDGMLPAAMVTWLLLGVVARAAETVF